MSTTTNYPVRELVEWCEEQRDSMIRQNEMMESGKLRIGSPKGFEMVDETPHWIEENRRHIAELARLLAVMQKR